MGVESHYHSKKDRVFVRGVEGQYSLKDELARLRAQPRVIKGKEIKFNDGPQTFSRHYVEPKDGITQTFHIHLEEFRIIRRNGRAVSCGDPEFSRKDVLRLGFNDEVEVVTRFRDFRGGYPMHCHNTVHEDHQMMLLWQIQDTGDNLTEP